MGAIYAVNHRKVNYFQRLMVKTGMNILSPLGRCFSENAEELARFALDKPVVTTGEAGLAVGAIEGEHTIPAMLMLRGGVLKNKLLQGFVKPTYPRDAAQQIFIAQMATLLGAPSAPYILIIGDSALTDLAKVSAHRRNCAGLLLFSAQTFTRFTGQDSCSLTLACSDTNSISLAAAGQFCAWLNDWDCMNGHIVRDEKTKTLCQFDHEAARPYTMAIDRMAEKFIKRSWETRGSLNARRKYKNAAFEMARRIHGIRRHDFMPLVRSLQAHGLQAPYKLIDGLLKRRELLEQPAVITPLARQSSRASGDRPKLQAG